MNLVRWLRGLLSVVALMGFGNALQCYLKNTFLTQKIYHNLDKASLTMTEIGLISRLFGTWLLLAASLRIYCAFDIYNKPLYRLTVMSFLLSLGHFVTELLVYKTMDLSVSFLAPLMISGTCTLFMICGYRQVFASETEAEDPQRSGVSLHQSPRTTKWS